MIGIVDVIWRCPLPVDAIIGRLTRRFCRHFGSTLQKIPHFLPNVLGVHKAISLVVLAVVRETSDAGSQLVFARAGNLLAVI